MNKINPRIGGSYRVGLYEENIEVDAIYLGSIGMTHIFDVLVGRFAFASDFDLIMDGKTIKYRAPSSITDTSRIYVTKNGRRYPSTWAKRAPLTLPIYLSSRNELEKKFGSEAVHNLFKKMEKAA